MPNYTVLARKYRSQTFDDLVGQEVLVKTLKTAIETNRVSHAYIFTGIRGTGKTSTARILAKSLNCLGVNGELTGPTTCPCGVCENCKSIADGTHIDVVEVDAASSTGVDNIRDIIENVKYKPTNGRYKIYIIDEVHMLSKSAFNALLKTLEEPPAHVVFILATTEINQVPITILSRCQRFDLVRVDFEVLKKHYASIAKQEGVELDDNACASIARFADGSVRDGLSLLDQAIAQTNGRITEEAIFQMLQRVDRRMIVPFVDKMLNGDIEGVLNSISGIYNAGSDLAIFLNDIMDVVYWLTRGMLSEKTLDCAPYTNENKDLLKNMIKKTSLVVLSRMWQMLVQGISEMQVSTNSKQTLDMLLIRIMHMSCLPPIKDLLNDEKLNNVKTTDADEKIKEAKVENVCNVIEENEEKVEEVVFPEVHTVSDLTSLLLNNKEITLLNDLKNDIEIIQIVSGKITLFNRKANSGFELRLKRILDEKTGLTWVISSENESRGGTTIAEKEEAVAKNDPLVQSAMGLFSGATITNIKGE